MVVDERAKGVDGGLSPVGLGKGKRHGATDAHAESCGSCQFYFQVPVTSIGIALLSHRQSIVPRDLRWKHPDVIKRYRGRLAQLTPSACGSIFILSGREGIFQCGKKVVQG